MKTTLCFIVIISLSSFLNSCIEKNSSHFLERIGALTETNPDKALEELASDPPDEMSVDSHMQYLLYKIKAKDKSNLDISGDTLIALASKYFKEKGVREKTATALYYSGRVYMEKSEYQKAMEYFLKASEHIDEKATQNYNLLGLIYYYQGYLYGKQANYTQAIQYYLKSQHFFHATTNFKNENYTNIALASIYLNTDSFGLALPYCEKALNYARTQKDSLCMSEALKKSGSIYKQIGDLRKAKKYFAEAILINTPPDDMALKCLFLSEVLLKSGQPDSALFYINQFQENIDNTKNLIVKAKYHNYLEQQNESIGDVRKALEQAHLSQLYLDSATIGIKGNTMLEIREKYNIEKKELKYSKIIKIENLILIISAILLLVIGSKLWITLTESKQIKKKLLEKEAWGADFEEKKGKLRSLLFQRFEISKKLALINSTSNGEDKELLIKINEIIYGTTNASFSWDEFYILFNELFDNLPNRLKQFCPQLSADCIHLCCLIKAGFSTTQICYILNLAPITVRMRQTHIRKKLGIKGVGGLIAFLNNFHQK